MSSSLHSNRHQSQLTHLAALDTCTLTGQVKITEPHVNVTKTPGSDADMPTFQEAIIEAAHSQRHTFQFRNEGAVSAFLGIQIAQTGPNQFLLTQTGLIDKVRSVTNLIKCTGCDTPITGDPLHADTDDASFDKSWGFNTVIGMIMYLASNTP
jgi:hypothetical protein